MKILCLNETFYPDVAATGQYLTDLAVFLAQQGWEVTVLTSRRSYYDPSILWPAQEIYKGVKILRVLSLLDNKKNKTLRILSTFLLNIFIFFRLMILPRQDWVISLTSPPFVGLSALIFSKLKRCRFLYWIMDLNPEEAIAAGWLKNIWLKEILERFHRFILGGAHKIVVLDRFMFKRIVSKGVTENKIHIIPPWGIENIQWVSHENNPLREKWNVKSHYVIMYSGNMSLCHPLGTLLEAAFHLRNEKDLVFLFIGGGPRLKEVLEYKTSHHLENILHLPYQDRTELKYSLAAADLHACVMGDEFVGIVHPCKIYGVLESGRPFLYIGSAESHVTDLMKEGNVGMGVRHGDSEGVARAIRAFREMDREMREKMMIREKSLASNFSGEKLIPLLGSLLQKEGV